LIVQIWYELFKTKVVGRIAIAVMGASIVVFIYYFLRLFYLMHKYHHHEFLQNRKPMAVFFTSTMIALTINAVFYIYLIKVRKEWDLKYVIN
jgi:hypothetical protein